MEKRPINPRVDEKPEGDEGREQKQPVPGRPEVIHGQTALPE